VLHSGAHFAGPSFFQFHLIIPIMTAFKQLRELLTRATFRCALCRALVGVHHLERVDSPRHKCLGHHTHRGALLDRSSRVNLGGAKSFDRSGSKGWGQGVKPSRPCHECYSLLGCYIDGLGLWRAVVVCLVCFGVFWFCDIL
jgi:hypothetical protein